MCKRSAGFIGLLGALLIASAQADMLAAVEAYKAHQYETARAQFQVLAEIGNSAGQFNLGVMSAHGEGGPKDAAAAVGWFAAAVSNGNKNVTPEKIASLRAGLNEADGRRADAILAQYGRATLEHTLLSIPRPESTCEGTKPARAIGTRRAMNNYPWRERSKGQNGFVVVEVTAAPDGSARDPEILMAIPPSGFSAAAIEMALQMEFTPASRNDRPVDSRYQMKFNFAIDGSQSWNYGVLKKVRDAAAQGDPGAQYLVGMAALLDGSLGISSEQGDRLLIDAAQAGVAQSQDYIAARFMSLGACEGTAHARDAWLHAAAQSGDAGAKLALAELNLEGAPTEQQLLGARALLEQAASSENYYVREHVTAILAAWPADQVRDVGMAQQLAVKLRKGDIQADPQMFEVLAAAAAANGAFPEAAKAQQQAIDMGVKLGWDTSAMQPRLSAYRARHVWLGAIFGSTLAAAVADSEGAH